jgi:hypothetical protein
MARLEDLKKEALVKGILTDAPVTVIDVKWYGSTVEVTYKDSGGKLGQELLYRDSEPRLEIVESGRIWSFDGDGKMLRLVSEAYRIHLAYLFDPLLAVHTSRIDHQRRLGAREKHPARASVYPAFMVGATAAGGVPGGAVRVDGGRSIFGAG